MLARTTVLPVLLASALAASCASTGAAGAQEAPAAAATVAPPAAGAAATPTVLLLGEVHDNPDGHAARLALLRARIAAGWRPAIAMEQFDREHQPDLDRAQQACKDAACVIAMASPGKASWNWDLYAPVIELALRKHLPLYAANLSRADAGKIVEHGYDGPVSADVLQPQVDEVRAGHCGMLPEEMLAPMATAQVARDVAMADVVAAALAAHPEGVALLAGNGHARRDFGVAYWLRGRGIAYESIGFVEDAAESAHFDRAEVVPAFARPDPCAKFKAPAKPGGAAAPAEPQ
jgi:uncharacterized iron-regulated protein